MAEGIPIKNIQINVLEGFGYDTTDIWDINENNLTPIEEDRVQPLIKCAFTGYHVTIDAKAFFSEFFCKQFSSAHGI